MLSDVVKRKAAVARRRSTLFPTADRRVPGRAAAPRARCGVATQPLVLGDRFGEYLATRRVHHVSGLRQDHLADFLRRERHRRESTSKAKRKVSAPTRLFTGFLRHHEGAASGSGRQSRHLPYSIA